MKNPDLDFCELQLKKRWETPYLWGKKQNDEWDRYSAFIYEVREWDLLKTKAEEVAGTYHLNYLEFLNYCGNRWYNFWSAIALEKIFTSLPGVEPCINSRNRLVDFTIKGIDMDLKTSVFPAGFGKDLLYARQNPEELIRWLYENQSAQQRQHFANRLFLIVHSKDGKHWKLKAELSWLKNIIESFVINFDPSQLKKIDFKPGVITSSDLIWAIK